MNRDRLALIFEELDHCFVRMIHEISIFRLNMLELRITVYLTNCHLSYFLMI